MGIRVKNIHKQFAQFTALDNINIEIPQGKLTALLGSSGCGKTTLLRIIAGLETPTSGQIFFDDKEVTHLSAKERHIGFAFQHYALFRHMRVADNIAFGLKMKPKALRPSDAEIQTRVRELLELVQLEHFAHRYPDQLSGGQRQRVALARAIAVEPKVLLLDEPFGALDAKVRKELRRWLREFHHEINLTTIFVTHDQEEALEVADQIILMNKGKIEQIGSPEDVYKRPQTAFVANFLGDVNLLHGYIHNDRLHIGNFSQALNQTTPSVEDVVVYVRPHEIALSKGDDKNSIEGKICHIHTAGPTVFIEVQTVFNKKHIDISISYNQYLHGDFKLGDTVYFKPLLLNFFLQSELIEFMI